MDVLEDIPVDQKIRVFEGGEGYHVVVPTVWEDPPPDVLGIGSTLSVAVRPARFEAEAEIVRVTADLSELGGPSEVPLVDAGDGTYRLEDAFTVSGARGVKSVSVLIEQETSVGPYWTNLSKAIGVLAAGDLAIYEEGLGVGWAMEALRGAESDLRSSTFVHRGSFSHSIFLTKGVSQVRYVYEGTEGIDPSEYRYLQFYINGGEGSGQNPKIAGKWLRDLGIVPQPNRWTSVAIPVSELPLDEDGRLREVLIGGLVPEVFYLDDVKLVVGEPTVVGLSEGDTRPSGYALCQNVPNPFNAWTTIRYALAGADIVRLSLYALSGQRIRTLVDGEHTAGSYSVVWDGTDEAGRDVASGVYVCRMETGNYRAVRKLVLVR